MVYFTYVREDAAARRIITSGALTVFSFLIARVFLIHKTHSVRGPAYFLAGVFLFNGIFFAARALSPLAGAPVEDAFIRNLSQSSVYLATLIGSMLWTFGIIILVNQRLNAETREATENAELIFNTSPDAVLITRLADGCLVKVNDGFTALTGFTRAEMFDDPTLEVKMWKDPAERQRILGLLNEKGSCENLEAVFLRKDGSELTAILSAKIVSLQETPHLISILHDITELKFAEMERRKSEKRYRLLADHANDVIWTMTPGGEFTYVSPSVSHMRGYTPEEVIQQPLTQAVCLGSLAAMQELFNSALAENKTGERSQTKYFEIEQPRKDGTTVWTEATARAVYDESGQPVELVSVSRDITERKRLKEELQLQASTDELTGVINRRHFLALAHNELRRALRLKLPLSIALIDIDYFKAINDTHGHAAGDQALKAFTRVCQKHIREIDVFARFGGDEFVLLFPKTSIEQAYHAVERVRLALESQPLEFEDLSVSLTISSGIASSSSDPETFDTLLKWADQALYQAKEAGRNRVVVAPVSS
jgi:diguanylate cyclase (GGDEF)-like protein/PAS domain S-box-containing protein